MFATETADGKLIVSGHMTSAIIAALPRFEGPRRFATPVGRAPALYLQNTGHNRELLRASGVPIKTLAPATPAAPREPHAYVPKTEPYPHQSRALDAMRDRHAFALLMEQGTGKTKVAIDRACQLFLDGAITGFLVLSKKGVHRQWIESEAPTHCGVPYATAYWPYKAQPEQLYAPGDTLKIFAINYDAIRTPRGFDAAERFCRAHAQRLLIVADESQDIKDHTTARHKAAVKLAAYSSHRIIATGTPIAKDLTDEWAQLKWLDENILGIRYVTAFRRMYCVMGGFQNRAVIGHTNVEEFKARTAPHVFRATKEEIGILPKHYATWHFDLTRGQLDQIRTLKRELAIELRSGETVSVQNAAVKLGKLQQLASGFVFDEENVAHRVVDEKNNPRLEAMEDWLNAEDGKAIVWFRFRIEGDMIARRLDEMGVSYVRYHGGVSDAERQIAKESFLDARGARVFVANPQSAGTGLNLQGLCSRALYYSNSFAAIDRWQSEDRIHRIGTKALVRYTDLVARGSIDAYILANLRRKKSLSSLVLDDVPELLGVLDQ